MDLSIIIVSYNTSDLTLRAIKSSREDLAGSSLDYETIVIDNNSSDNSCERISEEFGDRVNLIKNHVNHGFAKACNQGIRCSKGRHILFLNSDAEPLNGSICKMVSYLDEHPRCAMTGGQLLNRDGSKQHSIDNDPDIWMEIFGKAFLRKLLPSKYPSKYQDFSGPTAVETLIGACMCVSRRALKEVGQMDESYFFFMEETDWARRMRKKGLGVVFLPDVKIYHGQGMTASKMPLPARVEYYISKYRYFSKHYKKIYVNLVKAIAILRLLVNAFCNIVTACLKKDSLGKARLYARLWMWHVLGCPVSWGLSGRVEGEAVRKKGLVDKYKYIALFDRKYKHLLEPFFQRLFYFDDFLKEKADDLNFIKRSRVREVVQGEAEPGMPVIIKRYKTRGIWDFLKYTFSSSKALCEFRAALRLNASGVSVIDPVVCIEKRRSLFLKESIFVSKKVPEAMALADICQKNCSKNAGRESPDMLCEAVGGLAAELHVKNIFHSDLHAGNILVSKEPIGRPRPVLMDLHRIKFRTKLKDKERRKDLAYLTSGFNPGEAKLIVNAYLKAIRECTSCSPALDHKEILDLKNVILQKKAARRMQQAIYPKGSRKIKKWGYKIILRHAECHRLLDTYPLSPPEVIRARAKDLVKESRTSKVYRLDLGEYIGYYKIDNSRGWYDFAKNIFRPSRAMRAWRALVRLEICGFDAPPLIMAGEKRHGIFWTGSFLVTGEVKGAMSLDTYVDRFMQEGSLSLKKKQKIIPALAALIAGLHAKGIYHADLKGANILITNHPDKVRLYLIDADRIFFKRKITKKDVLKNLAQLNASFLSNVALRDRIWFYRDYAERASTMCGSWGKRSRMPGCFLDIFALGPGRENTGDRDIIRRIAGLTAMRWEKAGINVELKRFCCRAFGKGSASV